MTDFIPISEYNFLADRFIDYVVINNSISFVTHFPTLISDWNLMERMCSVLCLFVCYFTGKLLGVFMVVNVRIKCQWWESRLCSVSINHVRLMLNCEVDIHYGECKWMWGGHSNVRWTFQMWGGHSNLRWTFQMLTSITESKIDCQCVMYIICRWRVIIIYFTKPVIKVTG